MTALRARVDPSVPPDARERRNREGAPTSDLLAEVHVVIDDSIKMETPHGRGRRTVADVMKSRILKNLERCDDTVMWRIAKLSDTPHLSQPDPVKQMRSIVRKVDNVLGGQKVPAGGEAEKIAGWCNFLRERMLDYDIDGKMSCVVLATTGWWVHEIYPQRRAALYDAMGGLLRNMQKSSLRIVTPCRRDADVGHFHDFYKHPDAVAAMRWRVAQCRSHNFGYLPCFNATTGTESERSKSLERVATPEPPDARPRVPSEVDYARGRTRSVPAAAAW